MICPNCSAENSDTSRFCQECGQQLSSEISVPTPAPKPVTYTEPAKKPDLNFPVANIGGIACILSAVLIAFGWLLPWFTLGGFLNTLRGYAGTGGVSSFLFNLGSGIGNGIQIALLSLLSGILALSSRAGAGVVIGLLLLAIAAVIISIPFVAFSIFRTGLRIFETRLAGGDQTTLSRYETIQTSMEKARSKSVYVFVIMLVIFVLISVFPLGIALLSSGFYITVIGTVISMVGSYYTQLKLRSARAAV